MSGCGRAESHAFAEPIGAAETINKYAGRLIVALIEELQRRGLGVRRADLTVEKVDGTKQAIRAGTVKPVRDIAWLRDREADLGRGDGRTARGTAEMLVARRHLWQPRPEGLPLGCRIGRRSRSSGAASAERSGGQTVQSGFSGSGGSAIPSWILRQGRIAGSCTVYGRSGFGAAKAWVGEGGDVHHHRG